MLKNLIAEFFGTSGLVLLGLGSIVIFSSGTLDVSHEQISFMFGFAVFSMIVCFGKISGAHINPVVSLVLFFEKKISKKEFFLYSIAQYLGAIFGSLVLVLLFGNDHNHGVTLPYAGLWVSFFVELFMTFLLVFYILIIVNKTHNIWIIASTVGFLVGLEAYFGGPFTGASMNPARSLGPAVFYPGDSSFWLYLFATYFGACLAFLFSRSSSIRLLLKG